MVTERTFDYRPRHDEHNLRFAVADRLTPIPHTSVYWTPGPVLDQGSEGACVGYGVSGDLSSSPVRVKGVTDEFAHGLYRDAKGLDDWPGEDYEGTSVLAGMKAARARGYYDGYWWAFSLEDVRQALMQLGPVVIGIPWYESMREAPNGIVRVEGEVVGGHCLLLTGFSPKRPRIGEAFRWRNSWGPGYGVGRNAYISAEDLGRLLIDEHGEAAIPMGRKQVTA